MPGVGMSPPKGEAVSCLSWGPALRAGSRSSDTWGSRPRALFVWPQEAGDFRTQQLDEGLRQHLLVFLRVLEVVLGVGQDLKEGLDQLLVLQKTAGGSCQAQ